ncbi:MAG: hypothetical protein AAGG75_04065 [Bacteroidota bacterium]
METAIYLGGTYQYSQKLLKQRISLDFPVGADYLHSFYPGELYEQNAEGDFNELKQLGRPHFCANLGVSLTYLGKGSIQPFIRQELLLEIPYSEEQPIPAGTVKGYVDSYGNGQLISMSSIEKMTDWFDLSEDWRSDDDPYGQEENGFGIEKYWLFGGIKPARFNVDCNKAIYQRSTYERYNHC